MYLQKGLASFDFISQDAHPVARCEAGILKEGGDSRRSRGPSDAFVHGQGAKNSLGIAHNSVDSCEMEGYDFRR